MPSFGTWLWTAPRSSWTALGLPLSFRWKLRPFWVLWVGCRRRPFSRCWGSTQQSRKNSCSGCWEAARPLPSLTFCRGRRKPRWGSGRGAGRRPPSCCARQTSAGWAREPSATWTRRGFHNYTTCIFVLLLLSIFKEKIKYKKINSRIKFNSWLNSFPRWKISKIADISMKKWKST